MEKLLIAAIAALAISATSAQAATKTLWDDGNMSDEIGVWSATSFGPNDGQHSIWLPTMPEGNPYDFGDHYDFIENSGRFSSFADGTAQLIGKAESEHTAGSGFYVEFNYDNEVPMDHPGAEFKVEGSPPGDDIWYRDMEDSILTGYGLLDGLILDVTRRPTYDMADYVTQIGSAEGNLGNKGPNNKNKNYGMANWFFAVRADDCTNDLCDLFNNRQIGDVNVNLEPVPLPATGLMLIGGIGAMAAMRRRRKS